MQQAFLVALVAQHLGERGVELDQRNRSPARTRWWWRAWRWRRPSNAKVGALAAAALTVTLASISGPDSAATPRLQLNDFRHFTKT